jgi:hypothetical protein
MCTGWTAPGPGRGRRRCGRRSPWVANRRRSPVSSLPLPWNAWWSVMPAAGNGLVVALASGLLRARARGCQHTSRRSRQGGVRRATSPAAGALPAPVGERHARPGAARSRSGVPVPPRRTAGPARCPSLGPAVSTRSARRVLHRPMAAAPPIRRCASVIRRTTRAVRNAVTTIINVPAVHSG